MTSYDLTRIFMTTSEIGMMNMCCRHERVIRFPTTLLQAARLSNLLRDSERGPRRGSRLKPRSVAAASSKLWVVGGQPEDDVDVVGY
jgi:hypothetical protein